MQEYCPVAEQPPFQDRKERRGRGVLVDVKVCEDIAQDTQRCGKIAYLECQCALIPAPGILIGVQWEQIRGPWL